MLANPTMSVNCSKPLKFTAAGLVSPRQITPYAWAHRDEER